jgi:hypothetical protein
MDSLGDLFRLDFYGKSDAYIEELHDIYPVHPPESINLMEYDKLRHDYISPSLSKTLPNLAQLSYET